MQANREAPTLEFKSNKDEVVRSSTTAALAAKFTPDNDMEEEVAELLRAAGAHTGEAVEEAEEALALKVGLWLSCIDATKHAKGTTCLSINTECICCIVMVLVNVCTYTYLVCECYQYYLCVGYRRHHVEWQHGMSGCNQVLCICLNRLLQPAAIHLMYVCAKACTHACDTLHWA